MANSRILSGGGGPYKRRKNSIKEMDEFRVVLVGRAQTYTEGKKGEGRKKGVKLSKMEGKRKMGGGGGLI